MEERTKSLDLASIASWRIEEIQNTTEVKATIPALQRGLVWKSSQIELLWDSIFRGFPIGCLVACDHDAKQERNEISEGINHHLLDGQQRCHAISLGFDIPNFASPLDDPRPDILWLDLSPKGFPSGSTRQHLFRITKRSHPWGFSKNDKCDLLSAHQRREAVKSATKTLEPGAWPQPEEMQPHLAHSPVPLGYLMRSAASAISKQGFLNKLKDFLEGISAPWASKALEEISDEQWITRDFNHLWLGLQRAKEARIVLLKVPNLMEATREEIPMDNGEDQDAGDITNIAHLFHRLNTQGSALSPEELTFSMIKAYYPEVANTIEAIKPLRMAPSRLVHIAVRSTLSGSGEDKFHGGLNVTGLRRLAKKNDTEFKRITDYLGPNGDLGKHCAEIDRLLLYDKETKPNGIPAFLLTRIAQSNNNIFLLLLTWNRNQPGELKAMEKFLPGLVTLLEWFDYKSAADAVYNHTKAHLSLETLQVGLAAALESQQLCPIHSPQDFERELQDFSDDTLSSEALKAWNHWGCLVTRESEEKTRVREAKWWHFFARVNGNKALLLYAQRHFLCERFATYDQADSELWEDHNRPWDDDHILAQSCVRNSRSKDVPYKRFCKEWVDSIGNFWACPFEDNRSYGNKSLSDKAAQYPEFLTDALIEPEAVKAFDAHHQVIEQAEKARAFAEATQQRMVKLYNFWYSAAHISELIPTKGAE